ncbi:MAG: hypothetical protein ABIJ21_01665 [Nanoarchaeota archaeon]
MEVRRLSSAVAFGIEDAILLFAIILNVLELFGLLHDYLDYLDKIIAISFFGYLIYKISTTKLFFGTRQKAFDLLLILAYFLLVFKSIIRWAHIALSETQSQTLTDLLQFIVTHDSQLTKITFVTGSLLLLLSAAYTSLCVRVKSPSIFSIFHEIGRPLRTLKDAALRFFTAILVFFSFYIIIFNLVFEWLEVALDAPLMMLLIFIFIISVLRHHHHLHPASAIYRIAATLEDFYERVISRFTYKQTLFLGISGMLVLHLLTDTLIFILPYLFPLKGSLYESALLGGKTTLYTLLSTDAALGFFGIISHVFNMLGLILLLLIPAILWYYYYTGKRIRFSSLHLSLFTLFFFSLLLQPSFLITEVRSDEIVGVDIIPQSLQGSPISPLLVLITAIALSILTYTLSKNIKVKTIIMTAILATAILFFSYYVLLFFKTVLFYHLSLIKGFFIHRNYYMSIMFCIQLLIQAMFYIGGLAYFLYISQKHIRKLPE